MYELLFDGSSHFYHICHHFQDIHWLNVHDLEVEL